MPRRDRRALLIDALLYLASLGVLFVVALFVACALWLCGASPGVIVGAMWIAATIGAGTARRLTR